MNNILADFLKSIFSQGATPTIFKKLDMGSVCPLVDISVETFGVIDQKT